jgi:AcrR family transcriptional regulator
MSCPEFGDRVFDYLEGSLRDPAAFRAHLASCASCAESLRGIEENERLLAAARVPAAPADLWPRIAAAISRGRPVPLRPPRLAWSAAAAAAALLVAALLFSAGPAAAPPIDLVVREAAPEAGRTLGALVPRYEDVDAATVMAETLFRND